MAFHVFDVFAVVHSVVTFFSAVLLFLAHFLCQPKKILSVVVCLVHKFLIFYFERKMCVLKTQYGASTPLSTKFLRMCFAFDIGYSSCNMWLHILRSIPNKRTLVQAWSYIFLAFGCFLSYHTQDTFKVSLVVSFFLCWRHTQCRPRLPYFLPCLCACLGTCILLNRF